MVADSEDDDVALLEAIRCRDYQTFTEILSNPHLPLDIIYPPPDQLSILGIAIKLGLSDYVLALLQHQNIHVNAVCEPRYEKYPLHLALVWGSYDIVAALVSRGALIDSKDTLKRTPLHFAAGQGLLQITEYLVERGADVNAQDQFNCTPLYYSMAHKEFQHHMFIHSDHQSCFKFLLTQGFAEPNILTSFGDTPLHYAARNSDKESFATLLTHNADTSIKNMLNQTALECASPEFMQQILDERILLQPEQ